MKTDVTPEEFIEALNRAKMTPEERRLADAEKLGKAFGEVFAGLMLLLIIPTIIWAVLIYLVGFQVAWVKVFGIYFIFNFLKNIVIRAAKK